MCIITWFSDKKGSNKVNFSYDRILLILKSERKPKKANKLKKWRFLNNLKEGK